MREVHSNEKCPCGIGRRYGSCCKKKKFKWMLDQNGDFHRIVPLQPEAMDALRKCEDDFHRYFERSPDKKTDPVFLAKYLLSDREIERKTVEAMERAEVRPEIIYAYKKTGGLLLTRENEALMPEKDVQDWNSAIDEYFELARKPQEPPLIEMLTEDLNEEYQACLVCLGYILEHGGNPGADKILSSSDFFTVDDYVLLCATKSIKTLRSIKVLVEEEIGADGLALSRHLLENYLHIACVLAEPTIIEHLIDAQVGLKNGTHEFHQRADGKTDSRRIVRKVDNASFLGHISYFSMAKRSSNPHDIELFDYWYSFLSEYTHPSFDGFQLVIDDPGTLDPLSNELGAEASFFSICFAAMILDQLRRLPSISEQARVDVATVVRRIQRKANALLDEIFTSDQLPAPFLVLRRRLEFLGI